MARLRVHGERKKKRKEKKIQVFGNYRIYRNGETRNVSFLSTRELGASLRTKQRHEYNLSQFRGSPYMRHNAAAFPFSTALPSPLFPAAYYALKNFQSGNSAHLSRRRVVSFYLRWERERTHRPSCPLSIIPREACARAAFSFRLPPCGNTLAPLSLLYLLFFFLSLLFPPSLSTLFLSRQTVRKESRIESSRVRL